MRQLFWMAGERLGVHASMQAFGSTIEWHRPRGRMRECFNANVNRFVPSLRSILTVLSITLSLSELLRQEFSLFSHVPDIFARGYKKKDDTRQSERRLPISVKLFKVFEVFLATVAVIPSRSPSVSRCQRLTLASFPPSIALS